MAEHRAAVYYMFAVALVLGVLAAIPAGIQSPDLSLLLFLGIF
jgi:hypothetical protein